MIQRLIYSVFYCGSPATSRTKSRARSLFGFFIKACGLLNIAQRGGEAVV